MLGYTDGIMTVITFRRYGFRVLAAGLLWQCIAASPLAPAMALAASGTIAQGYGADSNQQMVPGAVVSLKAGTNRQVELASPESADRLVGVVDDQPLVSISDTTSTVQVVLSGTTSVLVSDANGSINSGDKIATSPLIGIGMKATLDSQVVGTAQSSFSGQGAETRTVKDSSGNTKTVRVGRVLMQVAVAYYKVPGSDFLPPFVQRFAYTIAGRPVALVRVIASTLLVLTGLLGFFIIVSSSIRNAMTATGRNPLAAGAIRKGLLQMGLVAIGLLAGTVLAAYLVLVV